MTRISAGIPFDIFSDQHTFSNAREVKRIPNKVKAGFYKSTPPKKFTLGTGHELFFTDKHEFTYWYYQQCKQEMIKRGMNFTDFTGAWDGIDFSSSKEYIPSQEDINIVVDRIVSNVIKSPQIPRYYGKPMSKEEYINKLLTLKK